MHLFLHAVIKGGERKFGGFDGKKRSLWYCKRMGMKTVFQRINLVSPELSCYKGEISPRSGALFSVKYMLGEPNIA